MKQNHMRTLVTFVSTLLLLSSCGSAGKSMPMNGADATLYAETAASAAYENDYGSYDDSWDMAMDESGYTTMAKAAPMQTNANRSSSQKSTAENDLENRKLIKNANLSIETQTFPDCIDALTAQIRKYGGYIENSSVYGNEEYERRSADYTIRIPEEQYESFLAGVVTVGSVVSRTESVEDVTLQYTDVESRIRSLETEYNTLLTILEKCDNVSDVIEVQNRITDVTYELDSYKSRLRTYDNLISYCTVYVNVNEVRTYTEPTENITLWQRITRDIRDNYADLGDGMIDFFIWLVSALPILLAIAVVVLLIVRAVRRANRKRLEREKEAEMAKCPQYTAQKPAEEKHKEPSGKI